MPYKAGRDPMTRAKIELAVYTEGELAEPVLQDHSVQEIDFTEDKETQAKAYTRTPAETDQVLVDNDELRITYIGAVICIRQRPGIPLICRMPWQLRKKNIRRALCLWIIQRSNKATGIMK